MSMTRPSMYNLHWDFMLLCILILIVILTFGLSMKTCLYCIQYLNARCYFALICIFDTLAYLQFLFAIPR